MRVIGIDNGLSGAFTILDEGQIAQTMPMPTEKTGKGRELDEKSIYKLIYDNQEAYFAIEEASKHSPGVLALCSTWQTYGAIKCMLKVLNVRYEIVKPSQWGKMFWVRPKMAKGKKFDTKAAALQAAKRIWPKETWLASKRCTKPHDGMVDSALIGEYARRKLSL